jgi:hypothetical protein
MISQNRSAHGMLVKVSICRHFERVRVANAISFRIDIFHGDGDEVDVGSVHRNKADSVGDVFFQWIIFNVTSLPHDSFATRSRHLCEHVANE